MAVSAFSTAAAVTSFDTASGTAPETAGKYATNPTGTGEVNWYSVSAFVITDPVYRVAGSADLYGSSRNATDDNNIMTYNEETGRYEKVYTNVDAEAISGYEYKITVGGASGAQT